MRKDANPYPAGLRKCARKDCSVVKKFRTGKKYCSHSCAAIVGAMNVTVGAAKAKAIKASAAAAKARRARAEAKAEGMTPGQAYKAGRKHGYTDGYKSGYYRGCRDTRRSYVDAGSVAGAGGRGRRIA